MKKTLLALTFLAFVTLTADAQLLPRNRTPVGSQPAPKVAPKPAAQPVEGKKSLGPVACVAVRMELRKTYRKQGLTVIESIRKANEATDDVINGLVADAEKVAKQKVGAIGDGTIIAAIIEWFKSPQGQAFIAALIELLLQALGGL